jgi:hypothetical protein
MKLFLSGVFLWLACSCSLAQTPALGREPAGPHASATAAPLSADEIRALIQRTAENDIQNDKKLPDYTYFEEVAEHHLDKNGQVKSTETKTNEVMVLYGTPVERLVAKDGKPLSAKEAAKEDERIQKIVNKRKNETPEHAAKRLQQEEKEREDSRRFVREVVDAYNFRQSGIAKVGGREAYVIDAEPRPGFEPRSKEAKMLSKFRCRVWIDKAEEQWVRLDAEAIDTLSFGLFLARIHKGSRISIEQTRVNDEVWLLRHAAIRIDARLALLKEMNMGVDVSYRDYKKFRSDFKIAPV